ncbi:MAG: energy-coupling factor ABC transporter permease [Epsilonproteobacteria bacterium]|nr:energy-coupling factor ABC transporter permease [Campylobacterota bacterium]
MHIPDGFISPQTYLPAFGLSAILVYAAAKRTAFEVERIPFIAGLSALSFILMFITIPILGGTSVHLIGVALMSVLFGPWMGFITLSLVLTLQAFLLGDGGVTSLPINIIAMAFFGSFSAHYAYRLLHTRFPKSALFAAGYASILIPSIIIAFALGIQPLIASDAGKPLYFPFGLDVTLVAVIAPNLLVGALEGSLTLMIVGFLHKHFKGLFIEN